MISQWIADGVFKKEIARRLSRDIKTVRRELKRNSTKVWFGKDWEIVYEPRHAQYLADKRRLRAYQAKQPLKSKKIYAYVLKHLREGWSPEQISGRLREVDHPQDSSWQICHETIYQFIYRRKTDKTKAGVYQEQILDRRFSRDTTALTVTDHQRPLWEYLRRKQTKRRKRNGRKVRRSPISDRISIHARPAEIEDRNTFGHWEGDSLVGKNHTSGLHTEYERLTSLIRFERLNRITSEEVIRAAKIIFTPLPVGTRKSTTLDNGSEHAKHALLRIDLGMQTYFADPYSAWQRGGNENANLWIRYYFPKGTDFSKITDEELKDVEWELNHRPRKRLNFKTPHEVFSHCLK